MNWLCRLVRLTTENDLCEVICTYIFYKIHASGVRYRLCLCFTSLQQRGNFDRAPPFTVPCEKREAR